MLKLLKFEMM